MNCKHCQAELEKGKTVCPKCGTDNQKVIQITPGKLALSVAVIVVLTAVLVALVIGGLNSAEADPTVPSASQDPSGTGDQIEATHPADTGLNDATCKGSYTVSDEEVVAAQDTVVATIGDAELTVSQLQIFYWMEVQGFLSSDDMYYAYYLGFDYTKPLDTQMCLYNESLTWQQYFLSCAIANWQNYQILMMEAEANGFELPVEYQEYLDGYAQAIEEEALQAGFADGQAYLDYIIGAGTTVEDYVEFMRMFYTGGMYYDKVCADMSFTEEQLDAYFTEHEAELAEMGLTRDSRTVNVRHILILPEGATTQTIYTETFSDEAWAAAEVKAQQVLNQWLAGEMTEESFAELANQNSADTGSNTNGGLYTGVAQGNMVEAFDSWCFDETRQIGDYGIVKTQLGYHIMYLSGVDYVLESYMIQESSTKYLEDAIAKYPMEIDYSKVVLNYLDMSE